MTRRLGVIVVALCVTATIAGAQTTDDALARGVPSGPATSVVMPLSLADAIHRGLNQNLAAILEAQDVRSATSGRQEALSALLPHASASLRQSAQIINTAAFGFSGFGDLPNLIGPFGVFDARVSVSAALFDPVALAEWQSGRAKVVAARADYQQVREFVVVTVGTLYLQAVADAARVATTAAQVTTAETLLRLATDQNAAGIVARIDVLRQQVQLETARSRAIVAANLFAKRKLQLARAIGLPAGQPFDLTDAVEFSAAPAMTIDAAVEEAAAHREDLKGAQARVDAARAAHRAASAGALPSLHLDADVGALGLSAQSAERTYSVAATLRVPVFEGGRTQARATHADAELKQREAELANLASGIRYDVMEALLDVTAAEADVAVARSAEALSREELSQAEDRFRAGVATTIELADAQDAVALASERYITLVYAHNVAKIHLARALGEGETRLLPLVGGHP